MINGRIASRRLDALSCGTVTLGLKEVHRGDIEIKGASEKTILGF
jgi:hypothetical protein